MEVNMTHVERFSWLYMGLECDDLFHPSRSTQKRLWGWSACHIEAHWRRRRKKSFFHLRDLVVPFVCWFDLSYLFSVDVPKLTICDPCVCVSHDAAPVWRCFSGELWGAFVYRRRGEERKAEAGWQVHACEKSSVNLGLENRSASWILCHPTQDI